MKAQSVSKLFLYVALCCVVVFTLALIGGCKGSDGAVGAPGTPGGHGSFGTSTCTDCHHLSDQTVNSLEPVRVTSKTTGSTVAPGTPATISVKSSFVVSAGSPTVNVLGYYWQFMDGIAATNTSPVTGQTLTVTLTPGTDYRAALVAREQLPDRTMVVPVNGFAQELAQNAEYMVTLFGDDGKIYYDIAKVKASDSNVTTYAPVLTAGINNVPTNMPVLLNAEGTGPYTWSFVTSPTGTAAVDNASIKNPYFVPDVAGQYVLNVVTTPTGTTVPVTDTLTLYAGTWRGAITGVDMTTLTADGNGTPIPDSAACGGCHNDSTAPDKFTPWKSTGHATRFEEGLNGGGYTTTCFPCHTVGFVSTGAKGNNGFRDQANYATFITDTNYVGASGINSNRYANMASSASYSALFKETGIQCENCHGPQTSSGHMTSNPSGTGPRTSLSSDVCGLCHGSPQHHGRFQEWQASPTGHASFELAESEGTNASCAGCHSAQGNLIYQKQLLAGNPLRTIPSGSITWTVATVQPQTCAVCHDPHDVGTTIGLATDAQPRITGNAPKLPAGFAATGVGKGAMCMICHNTRNGGRGTNSYLHEDNDPVFGMLTSYGAPHSPAQADVLMGHNAYFMGDSSVSTATDTTAAYRSPHATIVDTCVTCHMVKSPPNAEFADFENTNHTFKANLEICTDCHGIDSGLAPKLQMDTQTLLTQVSTAIQGAVISQATGTYAGNIASVALTTYHGAPVLNLTFLDTTPPATNVNPNVVVPINTDAGQLLAKGIWNYNLINNDKSLGVHNPGFARDVLGNTYAKMMGLQ